MLVPAGTPEGVGTGGEKDKGQGDLHWGWALRRATKRRGNGEESSPAGVEPPSPASGV